MHILHINCNLNLLSLYSIPCSKIQGSVVEAFIQLTVFVTGFVKTGPNRTRTEIQFIA